MYHNQQTMGLVQARDVNGRDLFYMDGRQYMIPAQHSHLQLAIISDGQNGVLIRQDNAPLLEVLNPLSGRLEEYNENTNYGMAPQANQPGMAQQNQQFLGTPINGGTPGAATSGSLYDSYAAKAQPQQTAQPAAQQQPVAAPAVPTQPANFLAPVSRSEFKAKTGNDINGVVAYDALTHFLAVTLRNGVVIELLLEKEKAMNLDDHTRTEQALANLSSSEGSRDELIEKQPIRTGNIHAPEVLGLDDTTHTNASSLHEAICALVLDHTGRGTADTALVANFTYVETLPVVVRSQDVLPANMDKALAGESPAEILQGLKIALGISEPIGSAIIENMLLAAVNRICTIYYKDTGLRSVDSINDFDDVEQYVHDTCGRAVAMDMINDILRECRDVVSDDISKDSYDDTSVLRTISIDRNVTMVSMPYIMDMQPGLITANALPDVFVVIDKVMRASEPMKSCMLVTPDGKILRVYKRPVSGSVCEYHLVTIDKL